MNVADDIIVVGCRVQRQSGSLVEQKLHKIFIRQERIHSLDSNGVRSFISKSPLILRLYIQV